MKENKLEKTIIYIVLIIGGLTMVLPFIWMLSTSLKSLNEVFSFPPTIFGDKIVWQNYLKVSDRFPFIKFFFNSLKISIIVVVAQVLTSSMAGFAFARMKFPGKDIIFALYLATLIVPFHVLLVPTFILMRELGWVDTHLSLIVPSLVSAFGTFLMRQFFLTIPESLEEAARIDGCTPFGIFFRIFLPLSKPALATLSIFTYMGIWNDFIRPLVFINTTSKMTLPLGLASMQGLYSTNWPVLMAGTVISLLPILIAFLFAQEYFVKGVTLSGLKG
ncbi:carbohydrate ABC transporter permease [Halanaerobium salsuginis]|jgi:multiple sugar transport system permease protein|uniref:Multiple sugar transport system permease protein n=1 Tax=Halanaerobium salsuginis TaxID=29563 RepID=A0A1I4JDE8_9FIRM|nr:carbohydrate ABC transporter permease [Halanaerobium salsuginis]SFL64602.1 multiple sugar transport system permease protein [Halanaerobium salsuginis]